MPLATAFTQRFNITHPIIQAGMAQRAGADLAAAVSNAGALGTIGSISRTADDFRAEIRRCRELTQQPFAVNVATFEWDTHAREVDDVAIEEDVPAVTLSFGDPLPMLRRAREAGIMAIVQVQDLEGARAAIAERADAIIVQGTEAGGHTGRRGTLSFAAQVLDMAGDIPVVVAGGVANGRGLAAALAMGAAGVVMGTRFKATPEFLAEDWQKDQIVASDGSNTLYDEIVDLVDGGLWPNDVTGRVLRNDFTEEWLGRRAELEAAVADDPELGMHLAVDPRTARNWAGEAAGLVGEVLPAEEVVQRTALEAEAWLRRASSLIS